MSNIDQNKWDSQAANAACAKSAANWRKSCAQSFDRQQEAEALHDEKTAIYWHNRAKADKAEADKAEASAHVYRNSSFAEQYKTDIADCNNLASYYTTQAITALIRAKTIEIEQLKLDAEFCQSESDYWSAKVIKLRASRAK